MARRNEGRETITELRNWDRGQAASERLAGKILSYEGFDNVDPSHPTGGPDGGKDFVCFFNGKKWIGAVYFPNGEKTYLELCRYYGKIDKEAADFYYNCYLESCDNQIDNSKTKKLGSPS